MGCGNSSTKEIDSQRKQKASSLGGSQRKVVPVNEEAEKSKPAIFNNFENVLRDKNFSGLRELFSEDVQNENDEDATKEFFSEFLEYDYFYYDGYSKEQDEHYYFLYKEDLFMIIKNKATFWICDDKITGFLHDMEEVKTSPKNVLNNKYLLVYNTDETKEVTVSQEIDIPDDVEALVLTPITCALSQKEISFSIKLNNEKKDITTFKNISKINTRAAGAYGAIVRGPGLLEVEETTLLKPRKIVIDNDYNREKYRDLVVVSDDRDANPPRPEDVDEKHASVNEEGFKNWLSKYDLYKKNDEDELFFAYRVLKALIETFSYEFSPKVMENRK